METFAERLIEERKRVGLTQDAMAKAGGIAKRTYCNYEAGEREPPVTLLVALKNAGCDIGYLLFGVREFDSLGIAPNEQRLLKLYRMLSESEQMSIEAVALAYAKPDLAAALVAMGNKAEIAAAQQTLTKVSASGSAMAAGGDVINTTTNNKVRKRKGKS